MAGKRHLESLDPVIFNKLPRLEPEPGLGLPASLCKASPLPPPGPESHCSYKGSYFACPLPSHDGPEPLARWSPAAAYLHYAGSAVGQPLRAEGTLVNCLLYRHEAESLGARLQPPSAEKGKDSLVRELLMPVAVHKAVAPAGCATLAVPKPVYRAPVCFVEPRAPPALATRADGLHKRPGDADWDLPGSAASFSPYYAAFEKYGPPAGAPFLEASYPAAHHPGKGPEVGGGSGGGLRQDAWSQLRAPAASPLPRSPAPAYRERPPACYPHAPYPLPLHRPALLYHPEAPALEKPASALSSVPGSYKAFGFPASGDPQPFPSTYLTPQVPRSYFAGPLESYAPRAAGSAEPPRRPPACKVDFPQPSPSFAFGPPDVAFYSASFAGAEPPRKGHGDGQAAEQDPPYLEKRRTSLALRESTHGARGAPEAPPAAPIVIADSPVPHQLKDLQSGEISPSSPPMPVINNVFSLAPYRDYLEGSEGSAEVPFSKDHPKVDTPNPGPQGGSLSGPGGAGGRGPAPDGVVLDLSLKKRLMKPGETQGPAGHVKGTSEGEDAAGEKEEPPRKVETGEGAKAQTLPLLIEVGSGDKSNFQSSATFMFKKYKILKSLLPGAVPPCQAARPQAMQPSPPAVAPSGSVPAPQSPHASPQPHSPPVPPALHADPQPSTSILQVTCLNLKLPDISKPLLPSAPEAPRTLGEDNVSLPSHCESPAQQTSASQYFTALHASLCNVISCSVSGSSPELLQEWLKRPTKGKEIWLAFKDVAALLSKLLSQLETFMFTRKCPFPHVVRAGAIFIPIHVVKEKLFPKLPGASVDQVLQEHKVELRPTTLSEEKLLRDLELKSCTSRMLKLLALKQLPDIYPDLLNLHWHDSVKQQLGRATFFRANNGLRHHWSSSILPLCWRNGALAAGLGLGGAGAGGPRRDPARGRGGPRHVLAEGCAGGGSAGRSVHHGGTWRCGADVPNPVLSPPLGRADMETPGADGEAVATGAPAHVLKGKRRKGKLPVTSGAWGHRGHRDEAAVCWETSGKSSGEPPGKTPSPWACGRAGCCEGALPRQRSATASRGQHDAGAPRGDGARPVRSPETRLSRLAHAIPRKHPCLPAPSCFPTSQALQRLGTTLKGGEIATSTVTGLTFLLF
uniref:Chromosome 15 open reading frame 39 n=1 Tax=Apteryx owenii TaxID=8824 RepID=A0A8B9QJC0_APTOW